MSVKNKHENKYTRESPCGLSKLPAGNTPIGRVPMEISANILSNPKQMRLSGKSRRRLQRGRGLAVPAQAEPPKVGAVKLALGLTKLTLVQLHRRLHQTARRASTVKHLIADLSPGSMFAISLKSQQTALLSYLKQVSAEIQSRNHQTK